jgi:hypothetical protein
MIDYLKKFKDSLGDIDKLEQTPQIVRDMAGGVLEDICKDEAVQRTVRMKLEGRIQALKSIHESSIEDNFKVIYSQMCVLAVSSLEAILEEYFEYALNSSAKTEGKLVKKMDDLKITLKELVENDLNLAGKFGSIFLEKAKLNFQDLKSIKDSFSDYLGKKIDLDEDTEKLICFYLLARHVLVHKGGVVDDKFISASTRYLNANTKGYKKGSKIIFNPEDWMNIKKVFVKLVNEVVK